MNIIITGPKGAGKSTHLMRLAEYLKNQGKTVGGVISRGFWNNNARAGYEILNPGTGETRLLCATSKPDNAEKVLHFCSYYFLGSAFAEGNRWISSGRTGDVLFVDEIGALELSGQGWDLGPVFAKTGPTVLGVREEALPKLAALWGLTCPVFVLSPGADRLAAIAGRLMNWISPEFSVGKI
jgi:nucleoside-triphosphatase THEP1